MRGTLRTIVTAAAVSALLVIPVTVWAVDQFTDVPDSNVFHDDIAWLADAGVTKGCNPPSNTQFCPSDNVTREQMAAFMRRLAENQVVDAATAVSAQNANTADNADMLDGYDALELTGVASMGGNSSAQITGTNLDTDFTDLGTMMVEAPADGAIVYTWSAWIRCSGADEDELRLYIDGAQTDLFNVEECVSSASDRSVSAHFVHPVTAGTSYVFEMRGHDWNGTPNITVNDARTTMLFVPFGIGSETVSLSGATGPASAGDGGSGN